VSVVARTTAFFRPRSSAVQVGPIGVDLALEAIHLVQLESAENRAPVVRARVSLDINSDRRELLQQPHQFRSLIKRALAADRFHGNKVVLALPSGMFRTVSINYQLAGSEKSEAAAIVRVMKDRLDGDLNDYVLDYMPVRGRSKNDERLALVAVSEREPTVNLLELARKAGLDVTALEIGPVAISRLVGAVSGNSDASNTLVVNSGRRASYMTLISGQDVLFDQEVAIGDESLIQHVCETLDMSEDTARKLLSSTGVHPGSHHDAVSDAIDESGVFDTLAEILKPQFLKLVEEIKRAILYAASETRGRGVTQVYLLGSIARWPGSDKLLSGLIGSKVATIPDPLALFPAEGAAEPNPEVSGSAAPEIAVATGLALRGMTSHV
jgi:type IV pilus assembly protein PilM